jgi:hypothetical protein
MYKPSSFVDILVEEKQEKRSSVRLGAHWQLLLLNYLVARIENTVLYESARTGNYSVAATQKLPPDAALPILETTEKLLITIGLTCLVCPRAMPTKLLLASCDKVHKPCVLSHTAVSIVADIEKLIWEVERRSPLYNKKLKEYSDRNLNDKLWYEVCESVVTNWSVLPAEQKLEKVMLIFLFILLEIMLMMLIYWAEAYILLKKQTL